MKFVLGSFLVMISGAAQADLDNWDYKDSFPTDLRAPSISRNGETIAYRKSSLNPEIRIWNRSTNTDVSASGSVVFTDVSRPRVSKDGTAVVFYGRTTSGSIHTWKPFLYDINSGGNPYELGNSSQWGSIQLADEPLIDPPAVSDNLGGTSKWVIVFRDSSASADPSLQLYCCSFGGRALPVAITAFDSEVRHPYLSSDGNTLVFSSRASGTVAQVYRIDSTGGLCNSETEPSVVSASISGGIPGDDDSNYPSVSDDGDVVAFQSRADNIGTNEADSDWDTFIRKYGGTQTLEVKYDISKPRIGNVNGPSEISPDGAHLAFYTGHTLTLGQAQATGQIPCGQKEAVAYVAFIYRISTATGAQTPILITERYDQLKYRDGEYPTISNDSNGSTIVGHDVAFSSYSTELINATTFCFPNMSHRIYVRSAVP